ncbi:hypothetical protein QFZ22_003762 [Streptomyces canus]|uniref:DUF397 domain-containing protein n=1 Tax=Streptomyces canus TaxID=58343 RepID=A0AAW8FFF9_9ACTN|nr:DUF397 domain-containing protein [Streptomyces canus]MDQ0907777.1 hypothetical protein [Streptomyces canus]
MSVIDNASATGYNWFKSSYSGDNNTCVECADVPGIVPVRDSKAPDGPALTFSKASWGAFVALVKTETYPSI